MSELTVEQYDKLCNEGFAELERLRAADMVKSPEYDAVLAKLRKHTKERLAAVGLTIVSVER